MIELNHVDVAGHLARVRLDIGRFFSGRAAAAREVAGDEKIEIVEFDLEADALGVQIVVVDGNRAAAQQPAARYKARGVHATPQIDHLPGINRLPRHAGVPRDRVLVIRVRDSR